MAKRGYKPKTRRNFLNKILKKLGSLDCLYCGQTDLIINHNQDPEIPPNRRATIDHKIPKCANIIKSSKKSNWVVSCEKCNQLKSREDEKWITKF